jgi:hypothetical protein
VDEVAHARAALRRDRPSEALVFLWNALEPARLAGDAAALRAIGGLAERVARVGDEGERREAERLLEEIREVARHEAGVPATEQVGAEVSVGGDRMASEPTLPDEVGRPPYAEEADADAETAEPGRRAGIVNLIWLLLVLGVVLLNILRGAGD